jgi:hypothetical protein
MKHLTDEQLVALLYGETENTNVSDNQHLPQCPECRERFQQLVEVQQHLNSFEVGESERRIDIQAILDSVEPASKDSASLRMESHDRFRMASLAIVASLLVLAGGLSFLTGVFFQTQQTSALVKQQVANALCELQESDRETQRQMNQTLVRKFEDQLANLQRTLAEQDAKTSAQNLSALQDIESQFEALLVAQSALRRDLQTLAVNAEGEISLAQNDIRRINEFVSILLPSVNQN